MFLMINTHLRDTRFCEDGKAHLRGHEMGNILLFDTIDLMAAPRAATAATATIDAAPANLGVVISINSSAFHMPFSSKSFSSSLGGQLLPVKLLR